MSQCQGIVVSTCFEKMRTMINFSITVSHVSGLPYGSTAGEESSITSLFSAAVAAAAVAVVVVPGVPFIDFRKGKLEGSTSASAMEIVSPGWQEGNGKGRWSITGVPSSVICRVAWRPQDAKSKKS